MRCRSRSGIFFAKRISELTMGELNEAERVAALYLLRKLSAPDAE